MTVAVIERPRAASAPPAAPVDPNDRVVSAGDWIGFIALVVGMFMAILDIQIVASSLSEIQAGVNASADEISWVQTSYLVAEVVMIPLSGWLARVVSTRWLFFTSCVTFTLASAACAMAWSMEALIVFRAVQGFLGGAMIPTVFATSFRLFPPRMQAGVSVLVGLVATMAPTVGPSLGGWITQVASWHWLFLINIVPGIIVATLVAIFVHVDKPNLTLLKGFDAAGIVLVALFLGSLQFILEEGPKEDWLADHTVATLAFVCLISAIAFFWRELTAKNAVIDLYAFRDRNFALGCVYSFIIGVGLYGSVYVVPLYLGRVRGYDSLEIGITMMVVGIFQFASAPMAGALAKKIDLRAMLALGLGLFGAGLWLNHYLTAEWGYWEMFLPQAVRGLALMFCFVPVNTIALGLLPAHEVQNASGLYNLMRNLGGAIGLAVINTQLIERFALHKERLAEQVTAANPRAVELLEGLTAGFADRLGSAADLAALKMLNQLVVREAMVLTFADVLIMMAGVFAFGLMMMPLLRKVGHPSADAGGH